MDSQTTAIVLGASIFGYLGKALLGRFSRETDTVLPAAITDLKNQLATTTADLKRQVEVIGTSVQEIRLNVEGMKNGFITRDKLDELFKECRRDCRHYLSNLTVNDDSHD